MSVTTHPATSSNASVTVIEGPQTGSDYVVMRLVTGLPDKVGVNETWDVIATVEAASAASAIRKVAEKSAGTYNAVPKRSWKPTVVKVETQTVVKLGDA